MGNSLLNNDVDIVVIQTSATGYERFNELISEMGLSGRSYIFRNFGIEEVYSKLDNSRRQLFITGTIRGSVEAAVSLVDVLKKKYPLLTCIGYACDALPCPPFDKTIIKPWSTNESLSSVERRLENYIKWFIEEIDKK